MKRDLFEKHWKIWCSVWRVGDREPLTYWFALQELPDKAFKDRSRLALKTFTFFPAPAEILEIPIPRPYHEQFKPPPELSPEEREKSIAECRRVSDMVRDICAKSKSVPLAGTQGSVTP